jgi:GntR family transcriptional regulator
MPGQRLPSEADLMAQWSVGARVTVRQALAILEREGLAEHRAGKGMFVPQPPPTLTVRTSRFSRAARRAGKAALAAEADALGLTWRSERMEAVTLTAPPEVAEVLGEPRARLYRRRMWLGGIPTQLADSYVPDSVDAVIGWSRGEQAPGGLYGLLERHGHLITRFREELMARLATPEEAVALQIPAGSAVMMLKRYAMDQAGRVVEYFDSVAVANRHRYVYEFEAPDD